MFLGVCSQPTNPLKLTWPNPTQPNPLGWVGFYWWMGWLTTQQSNSVSSFGNQNQLQLALAPFGELLKAVMLLSNLNGFNSPHYPSEQRSMQKKCSPSRSPNWKEKDSKWFLHFPDLMHGVSCGLSHSSFWCFVCLFVFLSSLCYVFSFFKNKKGKILKKYQNNVCLCIPVLVYLGWPLKQSS